MSLRSNQTDQMAKILQQTLQKAAPEYSAISASDAAGNPMIRINDGTQDVALARLKRRTFEGFNITLELDASAGNGYPEHELWFALKNDQALAVCAKLTKAMATAGCSELKFITTAAAPVEADLIEANVIITLPNDARLGSVGA